MVAGQPRKPDQVRGSCGPARADGAGACTDGPSARDRHRARGQVGHGDHCRYAGAAACDLSGGAVRLADGGRQSGGTAPLVSLAGRDGPSAHRRSGPPRQRFVSPVVTGRVSLSQKQGGGPRRASSQISSVARLVLPAHTDAARKLDPDAANGGVVIVAPNRSLGLKPRCGFSTVATMPFQFSNPIVALP